jgi:hypothetical protein
MMNFIRIMCVSMLTMLFLGCAAGPQVVYVTDAQEVTTKALEPVLIDGEALRADIMKNKKKWAAKISPDKADAILAMVSEQIARTKRFTIERESISGGKTYIIEPRIEEILGPDTINIPTDPTRKKIKFTARVRLDVKSIEANGTTRKHKSFSDTRLNEIRESVKNLPLDRSKQEELFYETVEVGFKAAANSLGVAFNPSFITGTVTKVSGRTAYISIDTSKLEKMPTMKRKVEVLDDQDQNKVIATIESLKIEGGDPFGTLFERGGTVKEGAKVRAQVNDLQQ